jgi:hypothetical protein
VPSIVPLTVLAARCAAVVVAGFIEQRAVVVYESVSVPDKYKNTPHYKSIFITRFPQKWPLVQLPIY